MVEEKLASYTFIRTSGGFMIESPFILEIGQTFEYWGLHWVVAESHYENDFICEQIGFRSNIHK